MKSFPAWSVASGLVLCGLAVGCGAESGATDGAGSDGAIASQSDALSHRSHHHSSTAPSAIATTPSAIATTTADTTAPAASAPPPNPSPPGDVSSLIAAAQNANGLAIPQPAAANGVCPQVVVALGFWACPTLGQTCSFSNDAGAHQCLCDRTEGEGQTPSWVCN